MEKAAPTLARIVAMLVFALCCFGLLVYLWLAFGGPVPLHPKGYRFHVAVPEATTLAQEADVRISGVTVGKVKRKTLDAPRAVTIAEIEVEEEFAPIPTDTRAILRQKTLLGEAYLELTPGNPAAGMLGDGGTLPRASVEETVELDELLEVFNPETQQALGDWLRELARSTSGDGSEDLNDALGSLAGFTTAGADVLEALERQEPSLRRLVRNTGVAFGALSEQQGALRRLIVNANDTFQASASVQEELALTIQIFPTFLRQSRRSLARLDEFSRRTTPLAEDLRPVASDLGPTVRDLGRLAPRLERVLRDVRPLTRSGRRTLPDAARFVGGAEPLLEALHGFLPQLNPVLAYARFHRFGLSDFIANGAGAINLALPADRGEPAPVHIIPQLALIGPNSDDFQVTERRADKRGNAYTAPGIYGRFGADGVIPAFDCMPEGGERREPRASAPPCLIQGPSGFDGRLFPRVNR